MPLTGVVGGTGRDPLVVVARAVALVAALLAASAAGAGLRAQEAVGTADAASRTQPRLPSSPWLPRLRLDNDAYNFWLHPGHRSDEEYTNGVVASVETLRAPWWGRHLGGGAPGCAAAPVASPACLSTTLLIGQDMYTPNLDRPPFRRPDWEHERPYAAWLYVGGEGRRITARSLRTVGLSVGVTGAPALGKLSQVIAHRISAQYTTRATGWETQVGFEPGVLLTARQQWLPLRIAPGGRGLLDLAPSVGASLGNIRTAGDVGGKVRLGVNLSHPWDPRAWRGRPDWEWHVHAAARAEHVARDFSLDGTLLRRSDRAVTRVPGVREYEFGTALRLYRLTLGWRAITRSREYTTGPSRHAFSQMYSAIEFRP
jgi:lipid A 3-O-deacylase